MQVSVEATNNIERRITIVVPFEKVDQAFDKRVQTLAKTAKVKGFRPGKVPVDYVRQRFGDTARQEALSEIIQSSLYSALAQEKLSPVSTPVVEPKSILTGQPLEFVATFEILPTIEKVNFQLDAVEKDTTIINDAVLENVIQQLLTQHADWQMVDRSAQLNDRVTVDFLGTIEGVPFAGGEAKNYPITLGSKTMIAGFEDGILGANPNEERVINLTFPENYFAKEVAGKETQFKITVKKVFESKLPELNETFIKTKLGIQSGQMDDLKIEIKKNLDREVLRLTQEKLKMKIFDKLIELNPIEVPKALIKNEAERIHARLHPHHGKNHEHSEAEMASFYDAAKKNVILGLLIGTLAKQHDLKLEASRIDEYIKNAASTYEKPEEIIAWYEKNKNQRAEIEMHVMEDMVLEKLLENLTVTEKVQSYEDFSKRHINE